LRVWNDDTIAPKSGFPPHPHRDMEIITYVRTGAITHKDSLGNTGRTAAGDVQVMSAGSGITHAEYNLEDEVTTLFQIWISPPPAAASPAGAPSNSRAANAPGKWSCWPAVTRMMTMPCRSAPKGACWGDDPGR
jgi:redox-sensitive bicupin YhaK (pirin superfamily)